MRTISVRPTEEANRFFVLILRSDGSKIIDAVSYSRLTAKQKAMLSDDSRK